MAVLLYYSFCIIAKHTPNCLVEPFFELLHKNRNLRKKTMFIIENDI